MAADPPPLLHSSIHIHTRKQRSCGRQSLPYQSVSRRSVRFYPPTASRPRIPNRNWHGTLEQLTVVEKTWVNQHPGWYRGKIPKFHLNNF
jgi:hypothetical protein